MSITKEYHQLEVHGSITSEGIVIQTPIGSTSGYRFPTSDGTANQVLATNGAGQLVFQNATSLALTTDDVPEGLTNLYFTNERVDDRIAALIQNGLGINWTYDDVANTFTGNVTLAPFTTDDLTEGATNLYFTNEKVDDRVSQLIINGTGLTWTYDDAANTLQGVVSLAPFDTDDLAEGSTNLYFTDEAAQDAVAAMIQNGTGISFVYNDLANTLTPTVTLSPFTTDDLPQGMSNLYLTNEAIDDRVAALVQNTSTVTWTYNDLANTLSADATSRVKIEKNGSLVGNRDTINFIEGSDIHLSVSDDSVNGKVNVMVSYNGSGGGPGLSVNSAQGLTSNSTLGTVELGDEIGGGQAFFTTDRELNLNGKYLEFLGTSSMDLIISGKGGGAIGIGQLFENDLSGMLHVHGLSTACPDNLVESSSFLISGNGKIPLQTFHSNLDTDNNGTHITLYEDHILEQCEILGEIRYDGYVRGNNNLGAGSPEVLATGISTLSNSLKNPLEHTFVSHTNTIEAGTPSLWPGIDEGDFFPISLNQLKNTSSDESFKTDYENFKSFTCDIEDGESTYDLSVELAKSLANAAEVSAKISEVDSKISSSKADYDEKANLYDIEIAAKKALQAEAQAALDKAELEKKEIDETLEKLNKEKTELEETLAKTQADLSTLNTEREAALAAYNAQDKEFTDLIALVDLLIAKYESEEGEKLSDIGGEAAALISDMISDISDDVEGTSFEEAWAEVVNFLADSNNTREAAINECQEFRAAVVKAKADADEAEATAVEEYNAQKDEYDSIIEETTASLEKTNAEIEEQTVLLNNVNTTIETKTKEIADLAETISDYETLKKSAEDCSTELALKTEQWALIGKELNDLLDEEDDGVASCTNVSYAEYYIGGTPYCLDDEMNIEGLTLSNKYSKFSQGWLYGADVEELEFGEGIKYELGHSNASLVIGIDGSSDVPEFCSTLPTAMLDVYGNSLDPSGQFTQYPFIRFRGIPQIKAPVSANVYVDEFGYLWQLKGGGEEPMNGLVKKMIEASVDDSEIDNLKYHYKFDDTAGELSDRSVIQDSVANSDLILSTNNGSNSIEEHFTQFNNSLRIGGDSSFHVTEGSTLLPFTLSISLHSYFDSVNTGTPQLLVAIADATDGLVIYESGGKLYSGLYVSSGGEGNQALISTDITAKTWNHISAVYDTAPGNQKLSLYLDKNLIASADLSGNSNLNAGIPGLPGNTIMLGGAWGTVVLPTGTGTKETYTSSSAPVAVSFKGYVDDFRIYSDALAASEIQKLGTITGPQNSMRLGGDLAENTDINLDLYNFKFKSVSQNTNYLNIGSHVTEENRKAAEDLQKELDAETAKYQKQITKINLTIAETEKIRDAADSTEKEKADAITKIAEQEEGKTKVEAEYSSTRSSYESRIAEENAGEPIWEIGCAENNLLNKPEDTMLSANGKISATNNIQIRIGASSDSYESTFSSTNFTPEGLFYTLRKSRDNTGTGIKFQVGDYVTNEWLTDGRAILINTSATQGETFYNSSHYAKHNSIHIGNETTGQTGGANYGGTGQIKSEYFSWNVTTPTSPTNVDLYTNPDTQEEIQISPAKNTGHFFFESIVMGMGECEANSITIKLKGSARVDNGGAAALIGSVNKTVEFTNGVAGTTTADAAVGAGKLRIRVTGEADDIMMWNANTVIHGMTWTKNTIEPDACGEAATQYVYKKCAVSEEDDSCGNGSQQITTLGLVGGHNKFRYGCCWYVLDAEGEKDETFTEIDATRVTPHKEGELSCEAIANLYGTEWENCVTKEKRISLCCADEINYPADVVISNLIDASGEPLQGCWKKIGYADSTGTITAQCPEEFAVPNLACDDDDCQPPAGFSYFLCEGQEGCEIPDFKVDEQIEGVEEGSEKIRFQCCWYEYRQLEASSNSVTIPGHVPVHAGTCEDAIKINGIKWKKCGSEEIRFSECCPSESQYNIGDIIDNLRDAGCKSTLPGCWEYQGKAQLGEEAVDTACCPEGEWNVVGTGSDCPEHCTDTSEYFILEECQTEEAKKSKAAPTTIQAGAQTGYTGDGNEIVIYDGKCYTVKTGGESGNDSLTLVDFTLGDCECCINRACVVATKYVDCESTSEEITLLTCGELSPGDWINISGECYNISDKEADIDNCVTYTYTAVENCEVCARGGVDIKLKQDSEDKTKYEVELKSKNKEIALRRFELDAEPASGAKITSATLKSEVFNAETWTSVVISEDGLRSPDNSDWTASDGEGYPNPATLSVEEFTSSANLTFDKEVDLIAEDIKNQQWMRSDGSIIPDAYVTVTIELASDEKEGEK